MSVLTNRMSLREDSKSGSKTKSQAIMFGGFYESGDRKNQNVVWGLLGPRYFLMLKVASGGRRDGVKNLKVVESFGVREDTAVMSQNAQ